MWPPSSQAPPQQISQQQLSSLPARADKARTLWIGNLHQATTGWTRTTQLPLRLFRSHRQVSDESFRLNWASLSADEKPRDHTTVFVGDLVADHPPSGDI
ncbi:hypothetical protein PIB30_009968 [Stylosanthes scabra]|uniref:Uncharacterized protein n=1 Tax=Stylosanthes scabra TaxID=79078 RepID=A0ABU6T5C5_9FABA|nr:hypothetical protein [Stylosanthes scabra]